MWGVVSPPTLAHLGLLCVTVAYRVRLVQHNSQPLNAAKASAPTQVRALQHTQENKI